MINRILFTLFSMVFFMPTAFADLPDFTRLIEANSPAVVKIRAVEQTPERRRQQVPQGQVPDIFRDFFGQPHQRRRKAEAMGSGFLYPVTVIY